MIDFDIEGKGNNKRIIIHHNNEIALVFLIEAIRDVAFVELKEINKDFCKCEREVNK